MHAGVDVRLRDRLGGRVGPRQHQRPAERVGGPDQRVDPTARAERAELHHGPSRSVLTGNSSIAIVGWMLSSQEAIGWPGSLAAWVLVSADRHQPDMGG